MIHTFGAYTSQNCIKCSSPAVTNNYDMIIINDYYWTAQNHHPKFGSEIIPRHGLLEVCLSCDDFTLARCAPQPLDIPSNKLQTNRRTLIGHLKKSSPILNKTICMEIWILMVMHIHQVIIHLTKIK